MRRLLVHSVLVGLLGTSTAIAGDDKTSPAKTAPLGQEKAAGNKSTPTTKGPTDSAKEEIVRVIAGIQFRMMAVSDEDPANDRSLVYSLNGIVGFPIKGLTAGVSTGFSEKFVAEEGDSAFRLSDSSLSVGFVHHHLAKKELSVAHRVTAWLPTSRQSLRRELRLAPTARSRVSYRILGALSAYYQLQGQYRWYRYAEVPNRLAMNTQWVLGNRLGLNYTALKHKTFGRVNLGTGFGVSWMRKYPSQDDHDTTKADVALWNQSLNWNVGLEYLPIKWVGVSAGIEHGSPLRRNGIINPFFLHRDQTEFVFGVSGYY